MAGICFGRVASVEGRILPTLLSRGSTQGEETRIHVVYRNEGNFMNNVGARDAATWMGTLFLVIHTEELVDDNPLQCVNKIARRRGVIAWLYPELNLNHYCLNLSPNAPLFCKEHFDTESIHMILLLVFIEPILS